MSVFPAELGGDALLYLENVTKIFNINTVNQKTALNEIFLDLKEGDFLTVIGSNGAGKSTLLNVIAGVYPIDSGSITLDGKDIKGLPEHKRAYFIGGCLTYGWPTMTKRTCLWL